MTSRRAGGLAAAAAAVVPLPLENVVRVAGDAAVLDAISGGHPELGVSNSGRPQIAGALGADLDPDPGRKTAAYLRSLAAYAILNEPGG